MTVKELIEALQKYDPDKLVLLGEEYEGVRSTTYYLNGIFRVRPAFCSKEGIESEMSEPNSLAVVVIE
jgi:hypothetical protein